MSTVPGVVPPTGRRRVIVAFGCGLALGAVLVVILTWGRSPRPAASAPDPARPRLPSMASLPLKAYGSMVVDPNTGRVFVTGSPIAADPLLVLDPQGRLKTALPQLAGASTLALEGDSLWVMLATKNAVALVDTANLAVEKQLPIGADVRCPGAIAAAGGRVWFSYGCDGSGFLGSVDPQTGVFRHFRRSFYSGAGLLLPVPTQPGLLAWADLVSNPSTLTLFDVSSGLPTERGQLRLYSGSDATIGLADMLAPPDGREIIVGGTAAYGGTTITLPGLREGLKYEYPAGVSSSGLALSPDGRVLAADVPVIGQGPAHDVVLFSVSGGAVLETLAVSPDQTDGREHAIAFSADGTRLFVITQGSSQPAPVLHILSPGKG